MILRGAVALQPIRVVRLRTTRRPLQLPGKKSRMEVAVFGGLAQSRCARYSVGQSNCPTDMPAAGWRLRLTTDC